MGEDKTLMTYHGIPQRDYAYTILKTFVYDVYLSVHPDRIPETDKNMIADTFLNLGPFGGVLSAFRSDPNSAWLAVACDMPLLNEKVITQLIAQRDHEKIATCFHNPETGKPEPLITIWEPRAYPLLLDNLSQGIDCLRKTLIHSDSRQLQIDHPELLRNANSPEEAEEMRKMLDG